MTSRHLKTDWLTQVHAWHSRVGLGVVTCAGSGGRVGHAEGALCGAGTGRQPHGAHELRNAAAASARVLADSTTAEPELVPRRMAEEPGARAAVAVGGASGAHMNLLAAAKLESCMCCCPLFGTGPTRVAVGCTPAQHVHPGSAPCSADEYMHLHQQHFTGCSGAGIQSMQAAHCRGQAYGRAAVCAVRSLQRVQENIHVPTRFQVCRPAAFDDVQSLNTWQ